MDTPKDAAEYEDPDWAYPLLRLVLTGASLEIMCATALVVLSRIGFVPKFLEPIVSYFVVGAVITGCWAIGLFLLYLWIGPDLIKDPN